MQGTRLETQAGSDCAGPSLRSLNSEWWTRGAIEGFNQKEDHS